MQARAPAAALSRQRSRPPPHQTHHPHQPHRRRRLVATAAPTDDAATAASAASDAATAAAAPPKTPWYEKNADGWQAVDSALDLARAAHAARKSGRRILAVDLYAPSCGVCKSSWPALSRLAREDALTRDVLFAKASIDGADMRRLLREQGITGIPWVLVLDVGETGPEPPPAAVGGGGGEGEDDDAGVLLRSLAASWMRKTFGGGQKQQQQQQQQQPAVAAKAEDAPAGDAAEKPPRVLDAAGVKLVHSQGASFKKIAVLRSNLTAVPALVKGGQAVVVDPNGLVVVA